MTDAPTDSEPAKRLEISKYPNRRYYDKTRSRHLTLEEIHAAIREGYEVTVTDSRTGEDISSKVLAQILLELDPPKLGVFPVPLLHRLLRTNEQIITDFTQKYFSQALGAFLDSQKKAEQYLRQIMGLQNAPAMPSMSDWARMMWGPFNPALWKSRAQDKDNASAPDEMPEAVRAHLEQMHQEILLLREQLAAARAQAEQKPPADRPSPRQSRSPSAEASPSSQPGRKKRKSARR